MMNQKESIKPVRIDLFSEEGLQYLRQVVSVVDIRNFARLSGSITSADNSASDNDAQNQISSSYYRYGCAMCSFQCTNVYEQREHFQSEWHLFNLRRRLKSKPTIKEETYEEVLKGSTEVHKSESSSSSSDDDKEPEVQYVNAETSGFGTRGGAVFFLTKNNQAISCYRGLLTSLRSYQVENQALLDSLQQFQSGLNIWIILILSGGHFAAAVFDNTSLKNNEAIVHKTVHRYTVRAKQGGSQSVKDAQHGKAKSAGATLRRFNEEALEKDILNLLTAWNDYVRKASAIFLRCAIYKRSIFFAGEEPLFSKVDQRIRNIPFVTRRPTYEETKRVRSELATLDVYDSYESFLQLYRNETVAKPDLEEDLARMSRLRLEKESRRKRNAKDSSSQRQGGGMTDESKDSLEKPTAKKSIDDQKRDIDLSQDLRQRLYTACKRGDSTCMRQIVEERMQEVQEIRAYLNTPINFLASSSTFLHLAAASGHSELVRFLLDFGCDPTKRNAANRVAYQVANGRPTKSVFVQFREDHPGRWDWNAAQVPEPMDPEAEAAKNAKMAERKKAMNKAKAEKLKEKKAADAKLKADEEEKRRYLELSDREKRALAAERRWQAQMATTGNGQEDQSAVLSRCFRCAIDMTGKVPFEYSENRFCSVKCLKEHRATNATV